METKTLAPLPALTPTTTTTTDYSSNVDTSRPFHSVKEAVAMFRERLLVGEIYSTKPLADTNSNPCKEIITTWKYSSQSPSPRNPSISNIVKQHEFSDTLKKLQAELQETKIELKLLKDWESETEIALATLKAELHKNMSKLAVAEAEEAAAGKNAAAAMEKRTTSTTTTRTVKSFEREEEMKRELMIRMENSPTLVQNLTLEENDRIIGGKKEKKMMKKKKPIVPLVTDFLFKKKGSSPTTHNSLYATPNMYFN